MVFSGGMLITYLLQLLFRESSPSTSSFVVLFAAEINASEALIALLERESLFSFLFSRMVGNGHYSSNSIAATKAPSKQDDHGRVMETRKMLQRSRPMATGKGSGPSGSRRERKIALQQDINKLKKRLRHEENVHRALERAFTRPLGALPRLPPYLPPSTLELLAEVAVLEEEVVRLEEQVVNFRHGLYQEAIYASTSKKPADNNAVPDLYPCPTARKSVVKKPNPCSPAEERRGKENQSDSNSGGVVKQSSQKKSTVIRPPGLRKQPDLQAYTNRSANREKTDECSQTSADATADDGVDVSPNRISEDTLRCLLGIFRGTSVADTECPVAPSVSGTSDTSPVDPYGIFPEFGRRDIGPYKNFLWIDEGSVGPRSPALVRKLRFLLRKLGMVDLRDLNHQQKLAFWINVYNSCMMNAFLEHGIPSTPQMTVELMQKAMINVGGHLLNAMTIEHFILRRPYQSKYAFPKVTKNDETTTTSILGLDWPEPLVTFALSCGSWSSPAVRVYTASHVEIELETAKRDYLQAAVGISSKLAIPKLLDWYLLDFAKDIESLMDWICLQLPSGLRNDAVKCIERARRSMVVQPQKVQVLPYDFCFRYILAT